MKNPRVLSLIIIIFGIIVGFLAFPQSPLKLSSYSLGLDLQGGTSITLEAQMQNISPSDQNDALESAKAVIERRVNFLGVSEPIIQTAKVGQSHRIIVELPGIKDINQALELIGKTAQLTFWETEPNSASPAALTKKTDLTGSDLKKASVVFDQKTGKPQVSLEFKSEGAKKFAQITEKNVGKPVAIALDEQIISAPNVNEPILNGQAVISGSFTIKEAKILANELNAGALPAPLKNLAQRTVGATLGAESIQKSLIAGLIGFSLVAVFMILFYQVVGFLAVLALVIYILVTLSIFRFLPVTLTLAGIAGFILSVGMAVDANILIFERFKEEKRWGKPRDLALELGFKRAWTSIRDSNASTLITCSILYYFGTGTVRGFALVLAIGVLVSMFSAIFITRTFLRTIYKN